MHDCSAEEAEQNFSHLAGLAAVHHQVVKIGQAEPQGAGSLAQCGAGTGHLQASGPASVAQDSLDDWF